MKFKKLLLSLPLLLTSCDYNPFAFDISKYQTSPDVYQYYNEVIWKKDENAVKYQIFAHNEMILETTDCHFNITENYGNFFFIEIRYIDANDQIINKLEYRFENYVRELGKMKIKRVESEYANGLKGYDTCVFIEKDITDLYITNVDANIRFEFEERDNPIFIYLSNSNIKGSLYRLRDYKVSEGDQNILSTFYYQGINDVDFFFCVDGDNIISNISKDTVSYGYHTISLPNVIFLEANGTLTVKGGNASINHQYDRLRSSVESGYAIDAKKIVNFFGLSELNLYGGDGDRGYSEYRNNNGIDGQLPMPENIEIWNAVDNAIAIRAGNGGNGYSTNNYSQSGNGGNTYSFGYMADDVYKGYKYVFNNSLGVAKPGTQGWGIREFSGKPGKLFTSEEEKSHVEPAIYGHLEENEAYVELYNNAKFLYNGHSYALSASEKTYQEAKEEAEALGGHLIVIENEEENQVYKALIKALGIEPVQAWIGLYRKTRYLFNWIDDTSFIYSNWLNDGNPDFYDGKEYAVHYSKDNIGYWNDVDENNKYYSIIEWDNV